MRICKVFKQEKQDYRFRSKVVKSGTLSFERTCRECYQGDQSKKHRQHRYRLVKTFDQMVAEQNGVCAICKGPPQSKGLSVDHCHVTGKVRALLCTNCNTGLGVFKDNPSLLLEAIAYIERYK